MKNTAIFPGSFDPFTKGHENIVKRALPLFDKITISIGVNSNKSGFFTLKERIDMIQKVFEGYDKVDVEAYEGLTVEYCKNKGVSHMLRGIRTAADFEYERAVAQMNKSMLPEVESVFLLTTPELTPVNSTIVRDIIRHGGDVTQFLPEGMDVVKVLNKRSENKV